MISIALARRCAPRRSSLRCRRTTATTHVRAGRDAEDSYGGIYVGAFRGGALEIVQGELVLDQASAGAARREFFETPGVLWGCETNHSTPGDPFR